MMIEKSRKANTRHVRTESLNELIFLLCKEFVFLEKNAVFELSFNGLINVFETKLLKHTYVSI